MFAGYFIALVRHWARVCKFVCAAVAVGIADPGWCKHYAWAGGGILQATGRGAGADISRWTVCIRNGYIWGVDRNVPGRALIART